MQTDGAAAGSVASRGLVGFVLGRGPLDSLPLPAGLAASVILLLGRLWLAWAFFKVGWHRIGTWDRQSFLFEYIHPVPGLSPELAAIITTLGELTLPIGLALGLLGRLSGLGLAIMAATIYFVVGQTEVGIENGLSIASEQFPWMFVGLLIFVFGPGLFSADALIRRKLG